MLVDIRESGDGNDRNCSTRQVDETKRKDKEGEMRYWSLWYMSKTETPALWRISSELERDVISNEASSSHCGVLDCQEIWRLLVSRFRWNFSVTIGSPLWRTPFNSDIEENNDA